MVRPRRELPIVRSTTPGTTNLEKRQFHRILPDAQSCNHKSGDLSAVWSFPNLFSPVSFVIRDEPENELTASKQRFWPELRGWHRVPILSEYDFSRRYHMPCGRWNQNRTCQWTVLSAQTLPNVGLSSRISTRWLRFYRRVNGQPLEPRSLAHRFVRTVA
jgi:hypothetical protein